MVDQNGEIGSGMAVAYAFTLCKIQNRTNRNDKASDDHDHEGVKCVS